MKIVLLGPDGQLGSDIRRRHSAAERAFDLVPIPRRRLDIESRTAVETELGALRFDALVNCTGYHKTDEVEGNADRAFSVNAHAVERLARLCAQQGARFIHASTDYVFGGDAKRTRPLTEGDPIAPVNVYGASKAMGETLAQLAHDDVVILRVASLFGIAGASGKGGNFVETMLRMARETGKLTVVDDQTMSPTSTADVADVLLRLVEEGCAPGVYHAVNSGSATWFEFACEIVRQAGMDVAVAPCRSADFPTAAMRPSYSALDNGKLARQLDRLPSWHDALGRYLHAREA